MKKRSGKIITLLAALSTAAAMTMSSFAGTTAPEPETRVLPEVEYNNDHGKYITIISPRDGDVFCTGQDIPYSFYTKDTWVTNGKDYYTKPFVEIKKPEDKYTVYHTMFEAFKGIGEARTYTGKISGAEITKSQYYVIGATYRFGVGNFAVENKSSVDSLEKVFPLSTIDITIADHAWDAGVVTKEPEVGEAGTKLFTCTRCHQTKTETIAPLQPTIQKTPASVKAKAKKKGKVTVSWKKIKNTKKNKQLLKQIQSIEIQYSTDPAFIENRAVKKVGKKKTSVSLKLNGKTTYYFRVRYIGNGGTSYWSPVKSVTTR